MKAVPKIGRVVFDACAMKFLLNSQSPERALFDELRACRGELALSKKLLNECREAVRRQGGSVDRLFELLDSMPEGKRHSCNQSALDVAESKLSTDVAREMPPEDRHLVVLAIAKSAARIISRDHGLLACRKLILKSHGVKVEGATEAMNSDHHI